MNGVITENEILELYKIWLKERAKHQNRGCRLPKDWKSVRRGAWTSISKFAALIEGSEVEPQAYIRACLNSIKNCQVGYLATQRGLDAYEKYHNLQIKPLATAVQEINRSLNWCFEYCEKNEIEFQDYLFTLKGKSKVAIIHLEAKLLSPYLLVLHPQYTNFMEGLEVDEKKTVLQYVEPAYYDITKKKDKYLRIHNALKAM